MITFILLAGHFSPGYSHITDTVSKLSEQGSPNPEIMTAGFISYGVLITGFAYALYLRLRRGVRAHAAWFALTLYGVSMILGGVFQDSPIQDNAALNTEGVLHNAAIITSCLALLIGMWMFAGNVYRRPSWSGFTRFTIAASFVGLILSIVFAFQTSVPASGLLQRAFYLVLLLWVEVVAIWLLRLSFRRAPT